VDAYDEHRHEYPGWDDQDPDMRFAPTPDAFNPVWSGLESLLGSAYQWATWADIEAPGAVHVTELFKAADQVVTERLKHSMACSQAVLLTYSSASVAQLKPLRALERNAVKRLDERLKAWAALRELALNEVAYESWITLLRVAQKQHEQVLQMQAMADQHRLAVRRASTGERLAVVAAELACLLMQAGVLPPALAEDVARMTLEQRDAVEAFEREGRAEEMLWLNELLFSPVLFQGINFRMADGLLPRPLLWPVKEDEKKKGGNVRFMPGVHFKRHTEVAHAQRMATSFREAAVSLRLLQPHWSQLSQETRDAWEKLDASLERLERSLRNLAALVDAAYGNINRPYVEKPDPDDSWSEEPEFLELHDPEPSQTQWIAHPTLYYDTPQRIRLRFPEALARLDLSEHSSEERQLFCVVCHRTKASKHYCFRHEDESARSRDEIRHTAGRAALVEKVLHSSRTHRLSLYVRALLDPKE
jgi:hypothetical protein